MSNLSVIVTIHDQSLLLEYEAQKKFELLSNCVTYMFVGKGDVDKVDKKSNVIIARDLHDNIEDYKFLIDFTSWYACVRNSIELREYVSLIQYDVNLSLDFQEKTLGLLKNSPESVLGYAPVEMKNRNFIRDTLGYPPLLKSCKAVYGIDIGQLLRVNIKYADDKLWPATNNVAMHRDTLKDFVRWFTPIAMHIGNHKLVGHSFERAIKLFCILTGRQNIYDPNLLKHFQLNSHGTQNFTKDTGYFRNILARNLKVK